MIKNKRRYLKSIERIFNSRAAGVYLLVFAISIGAATFIENDFGTSSAQKIVYKSWWFTTLLSLFSGSILFNIFKFRMIQQKKWSLLTFHSAIIIILIGAAVTRYTGYEGVMHIREHQTANQFLTAENYLKFKVRKDGQTYSFDEPVLFSSLGNNHWNESYLIGDKHVDIALKEFIPNPETQLEAGNSGIPTLKIVIGGANGREEYYLQQGQKKNIKGHTFNFTETTIPGAFNIFLTNGSLFIQSNTTLSEMVMATQERDTLHASLVKYPLRQRALYSTSRISFVIGDFEPSGVVKVISKNQKVKRESVEALRVGITVNGNSVDKIIYGQKGSLGRTTQYQFGDLSINMAYGAKYKRLPFSIKLHDFILEKYPGTNNAASYASEVQLIDNKAGIKENFRIYMNHILDHEGYRFFQSSFDKDEKGTYLSVNHDWWGTWISYIGYFLLTLGMVITLFQRNSRFQFVIRALKQIRNRGALSTSIAVVGFGLLINIGSAKASAAPSSTVSIDHANKFSEIIVQDHRGRMKPIHTLSREIMRKVARKESIDELSADQIILGMFLNKNDWFDVPMIKLGKHERILKTIGSNGERAAYKTFFEKNGQYKLQKEVRKAYSLEPIDRGVYEKELLKIDERVNIMNMVFSGRILKIIPDPNSENNKWLSKGHNGRHTNRSGIAEKFFDSYQSVLNEALKSGDYTVADQILSQLSNYQNENGHGIIPSQLQTRLEIWLNKAKVFTRLSFFYAILGIAFLISLFVSVFKPGAKLNIVYKILFSLLLMGFIFHSAGLGIRWYVSGRAPWSNGYESMIYIAWTTTLAGVIFTRKSFGGLAATMVLASTILLVALLSYMDPEITPLVPVLKSYWLTIHVSLEAGSYGFLMLGAVIGLINLILIALLREKNRDNIKRMVKEMSYLSEITLIGGLIMISTGTYLGGIWANESWGRYWGWDAKETWALVTILVYAFILHMRIIPKLFNLYTYNLSTIFGLASVIMTYYGVNYYLSGLHSYAAGDPVPIPSWVYIAIAIVTVISLMAYWKKRKYSFS